MREFLKKAHVKVVQTTDIASPADLEKIFILESYGMTGTLIGKPLYDGRIDLEGIITFAKDHGKSHLDEPTYTEAG
jgi:phosphoribosylformimino-5-aminoimidazole carboxamide ribonucleotide (ProFAR) isomerase